MDVPHSSAVRSMELNTDLYSPIVIRQGIVAKVPTNPRSRHADKGTGKYQGLMLWGADVGDLLLAGKQALQNCRQREERFQLLQENNRGIRSVNSLGYSTTMLSDMTFV